MIKDLSNRVLFDIRLNDLENSQKINSDDCFRNFKSILESFVNLLNEIKKMRNENKEENPDARKFMNHLGSSVVNDYKDQQLPNQATDELGNRYHSPKRHLTKKNLIKKIQARNSSNLLNTLYNTVRKMKVGSFAEIGDGSIIARDNRKKQTVMEKNKPLFQYDSKQEPSNLFTASEMPNVTGGFGFTRENNLQIDHKTSVPGNSINKPNDKQKILNTHESSDKDSLNEEYNKIATHTQESKNKTRKRENTFNTTNRYERHIPNYLTNSVIGKPYAMKKLNDEIGIFKGLKASVISQCSHSNLMIEENIQEIKHLKAQLDMYKNHVEMMTSKMGGYSLKSIEIKNMVDSYASKNEEIYKIELENLQTCFETYRGFYEEELKTRRDIIEDLCKVIEEMRMKYFNIKLVILLIIKAKNLIMIWFLPRKQIIVK